MLGISWAVTRAEDAIFLIAAGEANGILMVGIIVRVANGRRLWLRKETWKTRDKIRDEDMDGKRMVSASVEKAEVGGS